MAAVSCWLLPVVLVFGAAVLQLISVTRYLAGNLASPPVARSVRTLIGFLIAFSGYDEPEPISFEGHKPELEE